MNFIAQIQMIRRLDALIRRKGTGTPEELASRLEISRATVFRHLDDLKTLGAPLKFSRDRQSYYYEEEFELRL